MCTHFNDVIMSISHIALPYQVMSVNPIKFVLIVLAVSFIYNVQTRTEAIKRHRLDLEYMGITF